METFHSDFEYCLTQVPRRLLERAIPAVPKLYFPIVDVRDVAAAHVKALTEPKAAGLYSSYLYLIIHPSERSLAICQSRVANGQGKIFFFKVSEKLGNFTKSQGIL